MFSFFEKLINPFPAIEPTPAPKGLVAFCRHYTRGMEFPLLMLALTTSLVAILEVSLFNFMGDLVNWLIEKDPSTLWQEEKATLLWMSAVLLVILPTLSFLNSAFEHQSLLGNFPMSIRWQSHRYLMKQSVGFFQNDFAGRIATKVMQTALAVRQSVMQLMNVLLYVAVYVTSIIVVIAQADFRLVIPLIIWLMLYLCILSYFIPRLKAVAELQADARSNMTGRIVDAYTNINLVKLFSHTDREAQFSRDAMSPFLKTVYTQMRYGTGLNVCVNTSNYLLTFITASLCIWLWSNNTVDIGAIAVAIALVLRMSSMSHWVMWEVSSLFENIGTVADGATTLTQPLSVVDKKGAQPLKVEHGEIQFKDVQFHYDKGQGVIENFSLTVKPGEKVGLVGRSGAGKSTLMNLLLRFHDLESGKIGIDQQDISEVTQDSLRAQIGMVTQDSSLLHRTVRDNILYGNPTASEASFLNAAKKAQVDGFICDLSDSFGNDGYDALVGERGVKLSGGQRQRIAIARVLLKDAPILILDEATSALDSEVEAIIQDHLYQLMQGKTVIAIAHRLSTIAAMDRLIVIDEGQIVEEGTHTELVNSNGIYSQLWARQTGGFLLDEN